MYVYFSENHVIRTSYTTTVPRGTAHTVQHYSTNQNLKSGQPHGGVVVQHDVLVPTGECACTHHA